jgi:hypothetical protein
MTSASLDVQETKDVDFIRASGKDGWESNLEREPMRAEKIAKIIIPGDCRVVKEPNLYSLYDGRGRCQGRLSAGLGSSGIKQVIGFFNDDVRLRSIKRQGNTEEE